MKTIKIAHYDDNKGDRTNVSSYIRSLNNDFEHNAIGIRIELKQYASHETLQDDIEKGIYYDLLILDMYDDSTSGRVGENVLETINSAEKKIDTIIFTQAFIRDHSADFQTLQQKYKFILGDRIIKDEKDKLVLRIRKHITKNEVYDQFTINDDDIFLKAEILAIGRINLADILYPIKTNIKFNGKFLLERMSSGFSGAAVFRLRYGNFSKVLKISREKDTLKNEHDRAKKLYKLFPQRFIVNVENEEYMNNEVFAILIDEVDALPLFDWLRTKQMGSINTLFERLYLSTGGLKDHYRKKVDSKSENFTYIFSKLDAIKFSLVKKAIHELMPIIEKQPDCIFDEGRIGNLVLNGIYGHNVKNSLLDDIHKKKLILCHGDFHSKNILIQGDNPVIIDTGGIEYSYWCTDVCRLIVNLFIVGFDNNTFEYYDLHNIKSNLEIAKKIISLEGELSSDGINDSFIIAINWLLNNIQNIYEDFFSTWEFQLGLAKEFLQVSYRVNSIPPGKRALALLAAYQALFV